MMEEAAAIEQEEQQPAATAAPPERKDKRKRDTPQQAAAAAPESSKRARRGSTRLPANQQPALPTAAGPAVAAAGASSQAAASQPPAAKEPQQQQEQPPMDPQQAEAEAAAKAAAAAEQREQRAAAAAALKAQLLDAHERFEEQRQQRQIFLEADAALLPPESLAGRAVRVLWPDDQAWYLGTVSRYDAASGEHTVEYADGEHEQVVLALERVRLLVHAGEELAPHTPGPLSGYAARLRQLAAGGKYTAQAAALRRRAAELEQFAQQLAAEAAMEGAAAEAGGPQPAAAAQQGQQQQQQQQQQQHAPAAPAAGEAEVQPPAVAEAAQQEAAPVAVAAAPQAAAAQAPAPAEQGEQAEGAQQQQQQQQASGAARRLRVGEVGWFRVSGFPHWPFLVVTRQEALEKRVQPGLLRNPANLPVQYFGTGEFGAVNPAAVDRKGSGRSGGAAAACFAPFLDGLHRGLHAPARSRAYNAFRSALYEVERYLREGELPPCMLPWHNDGHGVAPDDGDEEAPAKPAAKRRKGKAAAAEEAGGPLRLPLQLKSLTVEALGEVEWLHPAFHHEKAVYPVGYRAKRTAKTGGREAAPHLLEVLRAPDGSGPLFRVTPEGGQPVQAATATAAWKALYATDAAGQARSLGVNGDLMFGLTLPRVQRAIEALPGARRCDRYCGWPEGTEPEPVPLDAREQRERLACEARMQRLPEGVVGVAAAPGAAGVCHVCGEEEEEEDDLIVQCNKCHTFVHMSCYAVGQAPHGRLWLCDVCSLGLTRPPPCALCPVLGGALKRTTCERWAHPACALWLPETSLDRDARCLHLQGLVQGVKEVHKSRYQLPCQVCQQRHGACTQCCEPRCYAGFHPLCARQAGYHMEMVYESDGEDPESEEEGEEAAHPASSRPQPQQAPGGACPAAGPDAAASCDENDAAAPNGSSRGSSRQRGGAKGHRRRQEGVQVAGIRLLSFCPKHGPLAAQPQPLAQQGQLASGPAAAAAAAVPRGGSFSSLAAACGGAADAQLPQAAPGQPLGAAGAAGASTGPEQQAQAQPALMVPQALRAGHRWGAARAIPLNHAARRGQRAPEAVAAAEAKRGFVRSLPYLVGGTLQQRHADVPRSRRRELPGARGEYAPEGPEEQDGYVPDPAAAAAGEGLQQQQQALQQQQQAQPASPPPALAGQPGSPAAGQARLLVSPRAAVKSDGDRFREMTASLGHRVTIGKSGIHGWGAFAKTRHAAHDMVIEYVGELVRPSVSDLRERRMYDAMVGAGTYVFRLNKALCVDATRAGNLAHMLNHSCDPNCYSRTISITEAGGRVADHVVIFAKRDVEAWEELTYDYRFCGDEQLPCNCGAAACRGRVNHKPPDAEAVLARRSELKPWRPRRKQQQQQQQGQGQAQPPPPQQQQQQVAPAGEAAPAGPQPAVSLQPQPQQQQQLAGAPTAA